MWGLLYVMIFVIVFILSAVLKVTQNPFRGKYSVAWSDTVGTVYTGLSYGEKGANKFDLYLPADNSRENYGLVVYLHAGGFTSGDKKDDTKMLQWLCAKAVCDGRDQLHPVYRKKIPPPAYTASQWRSETASPM